MQTLAEEKRVTDLGGAQLVGENKYVSAETEGGSGGGEAKEASVEGMSDPLNLAENYSKLIVGHMDFKTDPNQTQKARPPGWNSGMATAGNKGAADHQTELEKAKEEAELAADQAAVNELMSGMGTDASGLWDGQGGAGTNQNTISGSASEAGGSPPGSAEEDEDEDEEGTSEEEGDEDNS